MTSLEKRIVDIIRTTPELNSLFSELKNLYFSRGIIDADTVQAQAAEIKPRACPPVIIAKEIPSRRKIYVANR